MADYVLSNAAEVDLDDIYVYSFETFGETRAEKPRMGRDADAVHAGLLRTTMPATSSIT